MVTDYSSIGEDYYNSGGKNIIYYISDIIQFEKNQGKNVLLNESFKKNITCVDRNKLVKIINKFDKLSDVNKMDAKEYYEEILKFNKKGDKSY